MTTPLTPNLIYLLSGVSITDSVLTVGLSDRGPGGRIGGARWVVGQDMTEIDQRTSCPSCYKYFILPPTIFPDSSPFLPRGSSTSESPVPTLNYVSSNTHWSLPDLCPEVLGSELRLPTLSDRNLHLPLVVVSPLWSHMGPSGVPFTCTTPWSRLVA